MSSNETVQRLEAVDDTTFERLVAQYLRITKPELYTLIATGINEDGKPIRNRVDNILVLPGNPPPECIAVATTTTALDGLKRKWLGGKGTKAGDIPNAKEKFV